MPASEPVRASPHSLQGAVEPRGEPCVRAAGRENGSANVQRGQSADHLDRTERGRAASTSTSSIPSNTSEPQNGASVRMTSTLTVHNRPHQLSTGT
ncbi:hypothetical protein R6L23_21410 [Streptomyces sp. SR27]|uniref:hypothetical protein n=1 Tax=Streptomyces sp. SR27 TaxID=3076630 RepID=UPI00295ACF0E|nr:hypothetical protein [Streptomyces sp. SR27]MDV9190738.1 hypothetical protein [Streptomyces sp. SR27]